MVTPQFCSVTTLTTLWPPKTNLNVIGGLSDYSSRPRLAGWLQLILKSSLFLDYVALVLGSVNLPSGLQADSELAFYFHSQCND